MGRNPLVHMTIPFGAVCCHSGPFDHSIKVLTVNQLICFEDKAGSFSFNIAPMADFPVRLKQEAVDSVSPWALRPSHWRLNLWKRADLTELVGSFVLFRVYFFFTSLFFFSTTFLPSCVVRPLAIVSVICFGHWQLSCTCPILWAGAPCAECLFEKGPYCGWVSSEWSWPLKASQKGLPKSLAETSITIRSRNWEPQSLCAQRISHVGSLSVPKKRDLNRSLFMWKHGMFSDVSPPFFDVSSILCHLCWSD